MSIHILKPLPRTITRPIALLVLVGVGATMVTLVTRSYGQASPRIWRPISRATARPPCGAASITAARRSASPSARPRERMTDSSCRRTAACRCCSSARTRRRRFARRARGHGVHAARRSSSRSIPARVRSRSRARSTAGDAVSAHARDHSGGVTRTETRELPEAPVMSLNLSRLLANGGLVPGTTHQWTVLDPGDAAERR